MVSKSVKNPMAINPLDTGIPHPVLNLRPRNPQTHLRPNQPRIPPFFFWARDVKSGYKALFSAKSKSTGLHATASIGGGKSTSLGAFPSPYTAAS